MTSSRKKRNRSKQELRSLQRPANKGCKCRDRLTIARQHKTEHFPRLARAVKHPRFNPYLHYRLRPEFSSWKLLFWDSQQQEFTIQNTIPPSQQLVVPLRALTANSQQKLKNLPFFSYLFKSFNSINFLKRIVCFLDPLDYLKNLLRLLKQPVLMKLQHYHRLEPCIPPYYSCARTWRQKR